MKREHPKNIFTMASISSIKIRRLLLICVALLPLFSVVITAYHHHADLQTRPDCAICKSAEDLSSGDKQEPPSLRPLEFLARPCFPEPVSTADNMLTNSINNRAPPVPILFIYLTT